MTQRRKKENRWKHLKREQESGYGENEDEKKKRDRSEEKKESIHYF